MRLFVERVRDVRPDFRLTAQNGPIVTAICRRLDALPLALELAAPWMKALTLEDLLRRLAGDVLLSTVGARDLPERQQTMNATVAWSYQLLGPDEQRAFRRLGALPGRFPIEAAAAVLGGDSDPARSGEALTTAAGLIDKSLLMRADSSMSNRPLYQMLETVRTGAVLELAAAGELDDAMEGLTRYCTGAAALAAERLVGPEQAEWLDRVHDDLENYRGALTWLNERGRCVEASDIAWGLVFFWLIRGHSAEGLRWYEEILQLPRLPGPAEARALVGAALMRYTQGELRLARTALDRASVLADGDTTLVAPVETMFGHVEHAAGNMDAARDRFSRGAESFQALAIPWGIGSALSGKAGVALAIGDATEAERLFDEATAMLRHAGPWFLTPLLCFRATLAVQRGQPDQAIALLRESLGYIRELHDKFAFVYALIPLAAAAAQKGDDVWAARILGTRDAVSERTGAMVVDKSVHDLAERAEGEVRGRLGPDRWALAHAAGRGSSIDALMKDIDNVS